MTINLYRVPPYLCLLMLWCLQGGNRFWLKLSVLLLLWQVPLNLHDGLNILYCHWPSDTKVTQYNCNELCVCEMSHFKCICFRKYYILHARWPSEHMENNLCETTEVLCMCATVSAVGWQLLLIHSDPTQLSKTHILHEEHQVQIHVLAHTVMHTVIYDLTHCTLIICAIWLAELYRRRGGAAWLIGCPRVPRSCERKERYKSDRCQNSQQGAVMEALKNETQEDGEKSERDNMEGRGKGREITWLLEKTPFKFRFFDTFTNMTVGNIGRSSLLLLLKFIKPLKVVFDMSCMHCQTLLNKMLVTSRN